MNLLNKLDKLGSLHYLCWRGFRVFPLYPGKKLPSVVGWRESATTCFQTALETWWDTPRDKNANIGIATGEGSGIVVLDADTPEALALCEALCGGLPHVRTTRGGHFYMQYPVGLDIRNSASKVAKGIDVRGNGGLVVAPPSEVLGKDGTPRTYQWTDVPLEPYPMSYALIQLVNPPKPIVLRSPMDPNHQRISSARVPIKMQRIIDRSMSKLHAATEGTRNETLYKACFLFGSMERSRASVTSLRNLLPFAVAACGLEAAEAEFTAKLAFESGEKNGTFHWTAEDEREELQLLFREGI